jgi:periplasmic protein TonB
MNAQTRAYGISLGIHALLFSSLLALGLIAPGTRAVTLDFSLAGSATTGQTPDAPARRRTAAAHAQKTVTPVAQDDQAVPIRKERIEEVPQPVSQQPAAGNNDAEGAAAAARAGYVSAQFVNIRNKIIGNLNYPAIARRMGWTGRVSVAFTVCVDGSVEELSVVESSGFPILDKNALETIRKSCPLPKPPVRTALIMPVVYRLE